MPANGGRLLTRPAAQWSKRTMSMRLSDSLPLAIALLVGACGGDDDSAGGTDPNATSTTQATSSTSSGTTMSESSSEGSSTSGASSSSTSDAMTSSTSDGTTTSGDPTSSSSGSSGESGSSTTAAAGPTWENFGETFFESYCWECHGAGDPEGRDYSTLAGVTPELVAIRCGTGPAAMPPSGCEGEPPPEQFPIGATVPTADERAMLVQWIDDGAP